MINSDVEKEPEWCLHIRFTDGSNPIFYRSLTMEGLARELKKWNKHYKLWPEKMGDKRITTNFVWVMAERRHQNGSEMEPF